MWRLRCPGGPERLHGISAVFWLDWPTCRFVRKRNVCCVLYVLPFFSASVAVTDAFSGDEMNAFRHTFKGKKVENRKLGKNSSERAGDRKEK